MSDKPLHVQVAEVLGWEYVPQDADRHVGGFWIAPNRDRGMSLPRYDTDWSATGPLVEKYKITLSFNGKSWFADTADDEGYPSCYHLGVSAGFAPCGCAQPTALLAICHLILALSRAGKL